jgi:glycosyltransferase involved in cell wall biosynthesis
MARILEISSYPPPRAGWGVRVQYLKRQLEADGHECVVLNIGTSRRIPSPEYETVLSGWDYLRKVIRFTRRGFTQHLHVNGATEKGLALTLVAQMVSVSFGRRAVLTFHAGTEQVYFPRQNAPRMVPLFWLVFKLSRVIVCNSEAVKDKIVEYGVRPAKIVPIPAFSVQYLERRAVSLPPEVERMYRQCRQVVFSYIRLRPLFYPVELLEGFATVARQRPDVGLVLCGAIAGEHGDEELLRRCRDVIDAHRIGDRVCIVADLDHDSFLDALGRASVYLRSHVSDGVCSSVLESLSLGVPVVASENGTRPPGVMTYPASDPARLAAILDDTLDRQPAIAAQLRRPDVTDTLRTEVDLLVGVSRSEHTIHDASELT